MTFEKKTKGLIDWIKKNNIKKINIVGSPGSGKTKLTSIINKYLNFSIVNIDRLFQDYDNKNLVESELNNKLCEKDSILIDGTYTSILKKKRVENTNIFIIIKESKIKCFKRVVSRQLMNQSLLNNELISYKLLKSILLFNSKHNKKLIELIPNEKIIYWKW